MNTRLVVVVLLSLLSIPLIARAQHPARSQYKAVTNGAETLLKNIGGTYDMSKDPHRYIVYLVLDQQGNKPPSFWPGINAGGNVEFVATHDVLDDTISIVQKGEFSLRLTNSARKFGMYDQLPAGAWATTLKEKEFRIAFSKLEDAKIIGTREGKSILGPEGTLTAGRSHLCRRHPHWRHTNPVSRHCHPRVLQQNLHEDTWALNERVIDEQVFLDQAMTFYEEREKMFFDAVARVKKGLVTTVFDTTDRIQHMFYRYLDPTHPANHGKDTVRHAGAIAEVYERMDRILGRLLEEAADPETVIMVISDHGFANFRRGVNLNAWLRDHGYLVLKDGKTISGDWFENVDWDRTRAFSLGLTGLFINRKGRETSGIVEEGAEYQSLTDEIARKLTQLVDPENATRAIRKVEIADRCFQGPQKYDAPDLLVGYEGGYRNSWECATGAVTADVFTDNTKSWSGYHCVDPAIVPGVFFCNRAIAVEPAAAASRAPAGSSSPAAPPTSRGPGRRSAGTSTERRKVNSRCSSTSPARSNWMGHAQRRLGFAVERGDSSDL